MNIPVFYITQMGFQAFAIWMVTALLVVFGWGYLKQIITFVLKELYEYFIQRNIEKL